jgi:hypothetical protein
MAQGVVADCPVKPTIWVERQRGVSEGVKMGMGGRERVSDYAVSGCSLLRNRWIRDAVH